MSQAPILPSHDAHSEYEVRKAKVQQLREMGIVPYAQGYDKKHMISNLIQGNQKNLTEGEVSSLRDINDIILNPRTDRQTAGRLTLFRAHGKLSFGRFMDESGDIQLMFHRDACVLSHPTLASLDKGRRPVNTSAYQEGCGDLCLENGEDRNNLRKRMNLDLVKEDIQKAGLIRDGYALPYNKDNVEKAQEMRKNMTPAEKKLWNEFLSSRATSNPTLPMKDSEVASHPTLPGQGRTSSENSRLLTGLGGFVKFLRQKPIDHYIVDFYCSLLGIVIELDGSQHHTDEGKEYDQTRTERLELYGCIVLRFSNEEVLNNFETVCDHIQQTIDNRYRELVKNNQGERTPPCQGGWGDSLQDIYSPFSRGLGGFTPTRSSKLAKYEHTADGYIYSARAHIHNEKGQTLALYDHRRDAYTLPGGKVDAGESIEASLAREVEEEIGVKVLSMNKIGSIKTVRSGGLICHVHYDVTIEGTPKIQEIDKFERIVWVDIQSSQDILIDGKNIKALYTDPYRRRRHCYDFCETADRDLLHTISEKDSLEFPLEEIKEHDMYISLYDTTNKQFVVCHHSKVSQYHKPYIFLGQTGKELKQGLEKVYQSKNASINRSSTPLFDQYEIKQDKPTIRRNIGIALVYNPRNDSYLCHKWKADGAQTLIGGGIEEGEDPIIATMREVTEETGYKNLRFVTELPPCRAHFRHETKQNNYFTCNRNFVFELIDEEQDEVDPIEFTKHTPQRVSAAEVKDFLTNTGGIVSSDHLFLRDERQKLHLATITNETFGVARNQSLQLKQRSSARAVIINDKGEIGLMYAQKNDFYKLPGGGIDGNESVEEALRREILEETGYTVREHSYLGVVEEYREYDPESLHHMSHGFVVYVHADQQATGLTPDEQDAEFVLVWKSRDEALKLVQDNADRMGSKADDILGIKFMSAREEVFLKVARDFITPSIGSLGLKPMDKNMRIVSIKKCNKTYLFHGSSKKFDVLDPAYCKRLEEFGRPFVLASDQISNKFCYHPTPEYEQAKKEHGRAFHRIEHQNRHLLLGARLGGWLYVLPGKQFYEVVREDFEDGKRDRSTEYIAFEAIKPEAIVKINTARDCEMIEAYEFLGAEYVGTMTLERFREICNKQGKSELLAQVERHFASEFVPQMPEVLKQYLPSHRGVHSFSSLTTPRIIVRLIQESDIDDIYTYFTAEVAKYMSPSPAKTKDDTRAFVTSAIQRNAEGLDVQCVITDHVGNFLGCIGLHNTTTKTPSIGIRLGEHAQGVGYGQEAVKAIISRANSQLNMEYLIYPIYVGNTRSQHVVESMGGVLVDTSKKTVNRAGIEYDEWIYHIFPSSHSASAVGLAALGENGNDLILSGSEATNVEVVPNRRNHASAIILDKNGILLMQLRDDKAPLLANMITNFGGRVEEGETVYEGLAREMKEELRLIISPSMIRYYGYLNTRIQKNEEMIDIVDHIFEISLDGSEVLDLDEGTSIIRQTYHQYLKDPRLAPSAKHILEHYQTLSNKIFPLLSSSDATKFLEKLVDIGDFLGVRGELFHTHKGELTLFVSEFSFLAKALRPLGDKFHGVADTDTLYRQRYLDTIMHRDAHQRFQFRFAFLRAIREFYWAHDFMEVETPVLGNSASGAAAAPFITHHNEMDEDMFLRISPETALKKMTVGMFEKIFEVAKDFRNEGASPAHHQEFSMIEHYACYRDYRKNMVFTEQMFKEVLTKLQQQFPRFDPTAIIIKEKESGQPRTINFLQTPRARIDYIAQIKEDSGIDVSVYGPEDADTLRILIKSQGFDWKGLDVQTTATMIDYLYKKVTRPKIVGPAFIYNYPKTMQPLARVSDADSNIVEQRQLLVNGREVIKAYSELVDPILQQANFDEQAAAAAAGDDEATKSDDAFVHAMEYGMPPQSGRGMGIDRILALLLGQDNIRDIIYFPLMKKLEEEKVAEQKEEKKSDLTQNKQGSSTTTHTSHPQKSNESGSSFSDDLVTQSETLVKQHLTDTLLHCQQVAGCMRYFAKKLNLPEVEQDYRYVVGLLHDVDRDVIGKDPEKHLGEKFEEIVNEMNFSEAQRIQFLTDIRSHYPSKYPDPEYAASTPVRQYLLAIDELSGLMYAYARMRGGSFDGMEVSGVMKKIKDLKFAAGVDREHVKHCEMYLGIPLEEFVGEMIDAMKSV